MIEPELNTKMLCIKYLLVSFNLVFVITGICMILVGWAVDSIYFEYSHFLEMHFFTPPILLIVIGCIVFIVAFFGCCGAYKESTCMIMVFSMFLLFIFFLEIGAAVTGLVVQSKVKNIISYTINETMYEYPTNNASALTMDMLQYELHCCGLESSSDWENVLTQYSNTSITIPPSCCSLYNADKECINAYSNGCLPQLEFVVRESAFLIAGTATAIAILQLAGVIFACSLGKMIRFQKTERERQRWEMREQLISNYTQGDKGEKGPVLYMTITDMIRKSN
uniref:Tetraspanin n=1 Tax=Clastoptera arizonana TaxID=38151 RepID=A0A1B6E2I7_9HEMI